MSNQALILPDGSKLWHEGENLCADRDDALVLLFLLSRNQCVGEHFRSIQFDREAKSTASNLINGLAYLIDSSPRTTQITMTFRVQTDDGLAKFLDHGLNAEASNGS